MGCTCKITKGGAIGVRADGDPQHQWDRDPCPECLEYEARRNAQIPVAMKAVGLSTDAEVPSHLQSLFSARMNALTRAAKPI